MTNIPLSSEDEGENIIIPQFPYEVFPAPIREVIDVNCSILNLNIDYCSITVLFSVATAMGSTYKVVVKNGWEEMATLFCALVGKSGGNKSSPISIFTKPLEEYNDALFEKYIEDCKALKKTKNPSKDNPDLQEEPIYRQRLLKDTTSEATNKALYINPIGLGGVYDELPSFIRGFNKYNNGGGDEEQILSIFSGKSISVNRKNSPPFLIKKPFLSVIGGIQPKILLDIFGKNRVANGFTSRFLFAYPDQLLRRGLSDKDVPEGLMDGYKSIIDGILHSKISSDSHSENTMRFSIEAFRFYCVFRNRFDNIINNESREAICGIYSKLDIYFIRVCLILHVMGVTCGEIAAEQHEVSRLTAEKAEKIIGYFEKTALKIHNLMSRYSDPLADYPHETKAFYYCLPEKFTTGIGLELANAKSIKERTFFNYLKDDYLFTKIKHGEYEKNY